MADLSPPPTEAAAVSVPFFKKKARPRPTARQRSPSPSSSSTATTAAAAAASSSASAAVGGPSSTASTSAVLKPSRKTAFNPLVQGTHKRKSRYANGDDDDAAADDEFDGAGDSSAVGVTWQTSGSAKANNTNFVTGGLDWDADAVEDEEKRKRQRLVDAALNDGLPSDGLYHGAAAYSSHLAPARDSAVSNKMKAGPQKASSNIRQITVIDYQPDVCKDYKETGWCGFGDTCKFLHDRGDYLSGWQLDKQHASSLAAARLAGDAPGSSDDDDEIPFACLICRQPFGPEPVVTRCGHFFDGACAIKRFAKTPKCFACGAPTGGMFNSAEAVLKRLKAKQAAKDSRRREERGTPEGDDDGHGGFRIESDDADDDDAVADAGEREG